MRGSCPLHYEPCRTLPTEIRLAEKPTTIIGFRDGTETYPLNEVAGAIRLRDGSIMVEERGAAAIRRFDRTGHHLWSIKHPGAGALEPTIPTPSVFAAEDGGVWVRFTDRYDSTQVAWAYTNAKGEWKKTLRVSLGVRLLDIGDDWALAHTVDARGKERMFVYELVKAKLSSDAAPLAGGHPCINAWRGAKDTCDASGKGSQECKTAMESAEKICMDTALPWMTKGSWRVASGGFLSNSCEIAQCATTLPPPTATRHPQPVTGG